MRAIAEKKESRERAAAERPPAPEQMVTVYIMGRRYEVPRGLTILKAIESSGYRLIRGVGCRAGFCGACATVYRVDGDHRLKVGLACQTMIEERMYLTQIPFYPALKATYDLDAVRPAPDAFIRFYPEVLRCLQCNTCRKACPQDLDVMRYIAAAQRGDVARVADLSFDCIQCGLCASRCPAAISHYHVAQLGRRIYARHCQKPAPHLTTRIEEIRAGRFDKDLRAFTKLDRKTLEQLYGQRDIEADTAAVPGKKDED